jgi:hypothetical protein
MRPGNDQSSWNSVAKIENGLAGVATCYGARFQMRRTLGITITATVAAVLNLAAVPNYFTYAQWVKLSPEGRAAYIAGTFDSLVNRYGDDTGRDDTGRAVALHYSECLARAKMGSNQLGDNLQTYVSARPELQAGTVYAALVKYLADQCSSSHPQWSLSSTHIGRLG